MCTLMHRAPSMKTQLPNLKSFLFKKVEVRMKSKTLFLGTLVGYDAFCNLVLGSAVCQKRLFEQVVVLRGQAIEEINKGE